MIHPLTDEKLTEKDIIPMERVRIQFNIFDSIFFINLVFQQGGTGYSITNDQLESKESRPALQS